jgi:hypothetical protein
MSRVSRRMRKSCDSGQAQDVSAQRVYPCMITHITSFRMQAKNTQYICILPRRRMHKLNMFMQASAKFKLCFNTP